MWAPSSASLPPRKQEDYRVWTTSNKGNEKARVASATTCWLAFPPSYATRNYLPSKNCKTWRWRHKRRQKTEARWKMGKVSFYLSLHLLCYNLIHNFIFSPSCSHNYKPNDHFKTDHNGNNNNHTKGTKNTIFCSWKALPYRKYPHSLGHGTLPSSWGVWSSIG